ncbi:hypothetical protein YC2023_070603 [Brassica napus]
MQSEDKHQEQDQNHHPYPQPDSTRVIWKALQGLKLGADRSKWSVHDDAQKEFEKDHRLCLVAKGLNMEHQNSPGIKEQHRPTRHMASWGVHHSSSSVRWKKSSAASCGTLRGMNILRGSEGVGGFEVSDLEPYGSLTISLGRNLQ